MQVPCVAFLHDSPSKVLIVAHANAEDIWSSHADYDMMRLVLKCNVIVFEYPGTDLVSCCRARGAAAIHVAFRRQVTACARMKSPQRRSCTAQPTRSRLAWCCDVRAAEALWQVFDVVHDEGERHDLAAQMPDKA